MTPPSLSPLPLPLPPDPGQRQSQKEEEENQNHFLRLGLWLRAEQLERGQKLRQQREKQ